MKSAAVRCRTKRLAIARCMYRSRYYLYRFGRMNLSESYARKTSVFHTVLYSYIWEWWLSHVDMYATCQKNIQNKDPEQRVQRHASQALLHYIQVNNSVGNKMPLVPWTLRISSLWDFPEVKINYYFEIYLSSSWWTFCVADLQDRAVERVQTDFQHFIALIERVWGSSSVVSEWMQWFSEVGM